MLVKEMIVADLSRTSTNSEQLYQTAVLFLDQNLRCVAAAPTLHHWLALETADLTGRSLIDLIPELAAYETAVRRLHRDAEHTVTLPTLHRVVDGIDRYYALQADVTPTDDNHLLLIFVDITEPATHSGSYVALLKKRNLTLRLLNRAGQILTATRDVDQVLARLLQIATQIIGAEGSSVWLWDDAQPEWLICRAVFHPGTTEALLNQRVKKGEGVAGWVGQTGRSTIVADTETDPHFTSQIDAKSGFTTDSLIAVPLKLHGDVIGVLEVVNKTEGEFTAHDLSISETLAATAAVALDNARLVETLQERMAELKERNEELDAFDHTVAHDLKNPLSLITGFTDVLRQQPPEEIDADELSQVLDMIAQNARRMVNIVDELLLLSSVRKSDVKTQPLDMDNIVQHALNRLAYLREKTSAEISLPDAWPTAQGHPGWIEEVWENYLSNAMKYGGSPPNIELGAETLPDDRVRFWVRDNGQGLTEEEQARLFVPFTKLSDIRVTGQGLGLSIVCRIMEKLNGSVAVDSTPGEGSTFSFTLPAANR